MINDINILSTSLIHEIKYRPELETMDDVDIAWTMGIDLQLIRELRKPAECYLDDIRDFFDLSV